MKESNKKRILNVGCGSQTYGTSFLDIYPQRKGVLKVDVGKDKFPFKSDCFDEVYSKNLLEHISNPLHLLGEMKRVLRPGGKLILITDNAGFILFHIPLRKNNFLQHNSNSVRGGKEDRHYFIFTPLHLINYLNKIGDFYKIDVHYAYYSERNIVKLNTWIFKILNKTFMRRLINPHLVLVAYKK